MRAFSMIELVFVVVILGVIASIAIPKLSVTRTDAQYTAIMADIQGILSSVQQRFLVEDLSGVVLNGDFIVSTAGLSSRWVSSGGGVRLAKDGGIDLNNNCVLIDINERVLAFRVDSSINSPLCQRLARAYPNPANIELISSAIRF